MSPATPRASCIALLAALVGCGAGTSPSPPDASGSDTPGTDVTCQVECAAPPPGCHYEGSASCNPPRCPPLMCPSDAGPDVVDATPDAAIVCSGGAATSFPTFDRSCRGDADCFVAQHQTDCCGNSRAMGLAVSQRDAFAAAERVCSAMFPGCGCPARPPVADDGMTAVSPATIVAACRSGLCTSFVQ